MSNQMQEIVENISFNFSPEYVTEAIEEGGSKWLKISGVALVEGVSENKNRYTMSNLQENNGKTFKWLVGHPDAAEGHVVGHGKTFLEAGVLKHEGRIRNTSNHPSIIEDVKDGFYGPSIHARAKKVTFKEGEYHVEGLSIDGIGLVAFQGVKSASIETAIAESFDRKLNEQKAVEQRVEEKKPEVVTMAEEKKEVIEQKVEQTPVHETAEYKKIKEELDALKLAQKKELVESIIKINQSLKSEDLMKESDEMLLVKKQYEQKIAESKAPVAIVEATEEKKDASFVESSGSLSLTESAVKKFNDEIRARLQ